MRISLRYKFMSIVLLAALPFLFYAVYHYYSAVAESKKVAMARNLQKAEELGHELSSFIEASQHVLYTLALHPAVNNHDARQCNDLFTQLLPLYPLHLNILAADMAGDNFASAISPEQAKTLNYRDKEWFTRGSKGVSVITDMHISKLFRQPSVMITMPVFGQTGVQTAVLGFPVNLERLRDHFLETELMWTHATFWVLDRKGNILIHSGSTDVMGRPFDHPELLQRIANRATGSLLAPDQGGTDFYFSHATVEDSGWKVLVGVPAREVYAEANRGATQHLIFFSLFCLIGSISSLWYSRRLGNRVATIVEGLNEVAAGNFTCRLHLPGSDEISQASEAFNRMTAERARAEEQIRDFTATLERQVEQRTAELTEAKRELEAFTYAVSHDLQSPVRHLIAYTEILQQEHEVELSETGRQCLERIGRSANHMRDLITHLLELSRLSQKEIVRVDVDLTSLCRTICQELAGTEPTRHVETAIADGLRASGDPHLIEIVLTNLLGNAWKYTRYAPRPRIDVFAEDYGGQRCLIIKDNGSGFDMAYAGKLFTPFQRLHTAEEFEGTGVGLATVKRIIQRHGGAIWAESSPGQGAAFYVTFQAAS